MEKNDLFVSDWNNVVFEGRNELVFEDKNKAYGAYVIRKNYNHSVFMAMAIGISSLLLLSVTPKILEFFAKVDWSVDKSTDGPIFITLPPNDVPIIPPAPIVEKPLASTTKFVPPVVKDDAKNDDQIKIQDDLADKKIGHEDIKVDKEDIIIDDKKESFVPIKKEDPWTIVEEMPQFPGGEAELMKFFQKNIVYPTMDKEIGLSGTVHLNFIIDTEGAISEVKVLASPKGGKNLEAEAIRVVKLMPKWKAGRQNGRNVPVSYSLPVRFALR